MSRSSARPRSTFRDIPRFRFRPAWAFAIFPRLRAASFLFRVTDLIRRFLSPRAAAQGIAFAGLLTGLAACTTSSGINAGVDPKYVAMYSAVDESPNRIPAVNLAKIDPQYYRQEVATPASIAAEKPGTVVVDPGNRFLYLVEAGGMSMRYGVGVGRDGFAWSGDATIHDKQAWPKWFPPKEMMERQPETAQYANGMEGGIKNPLGARALYLWQGNKDTLYRLHGTNEPASIGHAMSSGCIRLLNQDVIDLYNRVPVGAKVVVLPAQDPNAQYVDYGVGTPPPATARIAAAPL
jgi:lipoprotein-anchoring transpeptidase ErfK/SrfK